MKATVSFVIGMAASVVFFLLAGLLSIQVTMRRAGAAADWNNQVTTIVGPHIPWVFMALGVVLSAVMIYTLMGLRNRGVRLGYSAGVSIGLIALTAIGLLRLAGPDSDALIMGAIEGIEEGAWGWIDRASSEPLIYAVILLAIGCFVSALRAPTSRRRTDARR